VIEVRVPSQSELAFIKSSYQVYLDQSVTLQALLASLNSRKDRLYVALSDDEPCGFIHAVWSGGPYELMGICVQGAYRRRGIGRRLLDRVLLVLRTVDASELWLEVRAGNLGAQKLYLNTGARQTGLRKRYYGDGADAVLMSYCFASES
jgi:ribosomal-protein-alanine acetyltransferase